MRTIRRLLAVAFTLDFGNRPIDRLILDAGFRLGEIERGDAGRPKAMESLYEGVAQRPE